MDTFFKQTSNLPYNRHRYKVWCVDGSVKILDDYEEVLTAWWNFPQHCSHVEVIDAKTKGGGFA
jgi:hypothetical protein